MPDLELRAGAVGDQVTALHQALAEHGLAVADDEQKRALYGRSTLDAVAVFQRSNHLDPTGVIDAATLERIGVHFPQVGGTVGGGGVNGSVILDYGVPASDISVRVYSTTFGGERAVLGETRTRLDGSFSIDKSPLLGTAIQVCAVDGQGTEFPLSRAIADVSELTKGALVAPGELKLPDSEYRRLVADVQPYLNGTPLNEAIERGERSDFTVLSSATGWDVAALALGASALDGADSTGIPAEAFYALGRAGLPANPVQLSRVHPKAVERILRLASESGVIDSSVAAEGLAAFKSFATETRLQTPPVGTVSSRRDLINIAPIPAMDKEKFSGLLAETDAEIWTQAASAGVSDDSIKTLQLQGKLAYLTFNSAPLVQKLQGTVTDADQMADELVNAGYHEAKTWSDLLDSLSGGDATQLASLVPDAFAASALADRRSEYCDEMARRVRQMDPHRVTVERVASGQVPDVDGATIGPVLRAAHAKGFRLGTTPVSHFFATDGDDIGATAEEIKGVKKLAALYAVSPSDEAMNALIQAKLSSATQIAKYTLSAFTELIKPHLYPHFKANTQRVTSTIYWKAQQHSATVFNVFDGLKRLDTIRAPFAATPEDLTRRDAALEAAQSNLSALFPSWETLFGSVDFCECDHCRSVLSPAAYLVDILHFLDPDDETWASSRANFKQRYGHDYPSGQKPFDLLDARRPDLKKIALTCENTKVELPYIDVVNEILEQVMLSDTGAPVSIDAYDVGTSTTPDLIAEPEHLLWEAYLGGGGSTGLKDLHYPVALPFDLPLDTVRAFLRQLGIELWQLRARLNRPTALDAGGTGRTDGWRDVWLERLSLSPGDVEVLTAAENWHVLYGYEDEATALAELVNAKTLARRLDLSYVDLVEMVVRTRFVSTGGAFSLRAPAGGTDFGQVRLEVAGNAPAGTEISFGLRKLNAFVRLRRLLSWDIHELDRVLFGLARNTAPAKASYQASMEALLVNLAHLIDISERVGDTLTREQIVLLWSDIQTTGLDNYYDRMFLRDGATGHDPAFDRNADGVVLSDNTATLADHAPALQQAYLLGEDDLAAIIRQGALSSALTIQNVSAIQRPALLARALGLPIAPTLALLDLTSTKPLSAIDPAPGGDLDKDHIWSETIAFFEEIQLMRDGWLTPETMIDLCRGVEADAPDPSSDPAVLAVLAIPAAIPAQRESTIIRTMAAQLSTSPAMVEILTRTVLTTGAPAGPLIEKSFGDAAAVASSVERVRRALATISALGVTEDELGFLMGLDNALDLDQLSRGNARTADQAKAVYKALQPWLEVAALRRTLGRSERALAVVRAAKTPIDAGNSAAQRQTEFIKALVALTGLETDKATALLDALGATTSSATEFTCRMCASPAELRKALETLRCFIKIRISPTQLMTLTQTTIGRDAVTEFRASLKESYARSSWRAMVKPIFDGLRAQRRDALVAHLTTIVDNDGAPKYGGTSEQLFEFLLLDPGMEPVVLGSRIQMAIASVQSFVQRCFMNLETGVDQRIIDPARWSWMRRYRVWEANRKIFLWPENWLAPELRDDKTHLFRQLEGTLLQGDVSVDLVRTAMYTYLQGLEQIARIHMLAMYFEPLGADSSVLHVIGRTHSEPYKYFSRSMSHGTWTPWVPIDIGIEGDHLVLTSWRGRLHLFWLTFLEEARQKPGASSAAFKLGDDVKGSDLEATPHVKLKVNWSEQLEGAWTAARSSPDFVETDFVDVRAKTPDERGDFFARSVVLAQGAEVNDDLLEIRVTHRNGSAHVFLFYSKLAPPQSLRGQKPPLIAPPYAQIDSRATKWRSKGSAPLTPLFLSAVRAGQGAGSESSVTPLLATPHGFSLLLPSNEAMPIPEMRPPAAKPGSRISGYAFGDQNSNHVTYRSSNGDIHDLFLTDGGWFYQSPALDAAAVTVSMIEPPEDDPCGYAIDGQGLACIGYCGATTVTELAWQQLDSDPRDGTATDTGWSAEACYQSDSDPGIGRPAGGIYAPDRGSVFLTKKQRIVAARRSATGGWITQELVPEGGAASEPTALVVSQIVLGLPIAVSRHVFYVGTDGDIYELANVPSGVFELASDPSAATWTLTNVSDAAAAPVKPVAGSQISAYASAAAGSRYVVYRGADGVIHELAAPFGGGWLHTAIGAALTPAKGDPCGYARDAGPDRHVVYRGADDQIVELWSASMGGAGLVPGAWYENVLSSTVPDTPVTDGEVSGYAYTKDGTQHVTYVAANGEARAVTWAPTGWASSDYQLTNPFADSDATLAAPFFFESMDNDDSFFVVPSIVETTVHTWTAWVVATDEYVVPDIDESIYVPILIPIIPAVAMLPPINGSLVKMRPELMKAKLFPDDVTLRTRWGDIKPRTGDTVFATHQDVVHRDAPRIVDLDGDFYVRFRQWPSRSMRAELVR